MKRTLLKSTSKLAPIKEEWGLQEMAAECLFSKNERVDILMVVRGQLPYVKHCVESIQLGTEDYHLFLWDNGSDEITAKYLRLVAEAENVTLHREEENLGFIVPNNRLAVMGSSPYIVLINSDCFVREGWVSAMTGWLANHPSCAQVGYMGAYLDETGKGVRGGLGGNVDYVCGHCFCISRKLYEEVGLFDEENLQFGYCEDSDFSLRLREAGRDVYVLHLGLVHHYGNKTAISVLTENPDLTPIIDANHAYLRKRWAKILANSGGIVYKLGE